MKKSATPKDIDAYIAAAPQESKAKLTELRKLLKSIAPKAEEGISYAMPALKLDGKAFVAFAGYKHHIGYYPMSGSFLKDYEKDLKNFKTSKGAVQFPLEKPLPLTLIKKLMKGKMQELKSAKNEKGAKDKTDAYTHYHKDGSIWAKGKIMKGQMHGYWEWFRKDGSKMRTGFFEKGKQTGNWVTYDKKGRIVKVTLMKEN